jgi:hypothetical protein
VALAAANGERRRGGNGISQSAYEKAGNQQQ